ncbi:MAG: hypothetical protein ACP5D9_03195 [Mariniphaga sp.]
MNSEKWNEICFLLSENIRADISESDFEKNVIQALRVLDWKEFLGDIQIRPSFQIGASNRITPDFVINSSEKKKPFRNRDKTARSSFKYQFSATTIFIYAPTET